MSSDVDTHIQAFLSRVLPVCEAALEQNETLNIFKVMPRCVSVPVHRVFR